MSDGHELHTRPASGGVTVADCTCGRWAITTANDGLVGYLHTAHVAAETEAAGTDFDTADEAESEGWERRHDRPRSWWRHRLEHGH